MAWISAGAEVKHEDTSTNTNQYGTRTPSLSTDWLAAFKKSQGNLNAGGYTSDQQKAIDLGLGALGRSDSAVTGANAGLDYIKQGYGDVLTGYNQALAVGPHLLGAAPTATAGQAIAGQAYATDAEYAGDVGAHGGNEYMTNYANPFLRDVVDTSVRDYTTDVDRNLSAIRAGRDSAGAFGDRSAIADSVYRGDATRGLGSLVSGLYSKGFDTAATLGQQDASRTLLADQGNQTTRQGVLTGNADRRTGVSATNAGLLTDTSKYNAGLLTDTSKFNTGIQNDRDISNQGAQYKTDANRMQALDAIKATLTSQAGVTQQQLDNVFKGTQIDTDAAQALFAAGQISQEQLNQILSLAGAGNGYSYTDNRNTTGSSTSIDAKAGFGV